MPPNEKTLRAQAVAAIHRGVLPPDAADRVWAGAGIGAPCAVCDLPVTAQQMEFETQFARQRNGTWLHACHLHVPCFAAWEFERESV